jgi:putative transposase
MRKTFKYRIYPTKSQISKLNGIFEAVRYIYNETLALRKNAWETEKKYISLYETSNKLTEWKKEKPELLQVQSQILQNAQLRVDLAFKSFFRRLKNKENSGYPRFKGKRRYSSITYPQSGFRIHPDQTVYLSKIGRVPAKLHRQIYGVIKTCTVKRTHTNKWYLFFSCEVEKPEPLPKTGKIIGIDLGLTIYIQCSDKNKIDKPRFFKEEQASLAKAQRKFSKFPEKVWSKEKQKAKLIIAKIHERIKNKREDFCHKASNDLIKKYDLIIHEALNVKSMIEQKKWSKSISDASWGTLIDFLTYKAENAGKEIRSVDPRGTSQRCSQCGHTVKKDISVRIHDCPYCGFKTSRDHNSSLEILRLGMQPFATLKEVA